MTTTNQEFEIVKDENLYECEIEVRNKIKDYNNRGYRCISQSITSTITNNNIEFWVISLLFENKNNGGGGEGKNKK